MNVAHGLKTQAQLVLVSQAYKALTQRHLTDDLRDELSPQEYQSFWNIMSKKPLK